MNSSVIIRCFIGLIVFVLPNFVFSQKKITLEVRIANDICECFDGNGFTVWNTQTRDFLEGCSKHTAIKYKEELQLYFESVKDSSYKSGYESGKLYFQQKIAPLLLTDCEAIKKMKNTH
ncbi:hypothetical protein [Algoriphagus pacificus]|uniref:Uncharacterized protein n=1 Tax=Algoriphagus pacificus TaxID=2811234 RepID=A0ABS3CK93_9BACT|nr:hypothetical protein [Algoriphagus pacificus]MBN7817457.1 hypothetical protein [Algoriphagus pacificus]